MACIVALLKMSAKEPVNLLEQFNDNPKCSPISMKMVRASGLFFAKGEEAILSALHCSQVIEYCGRARIPAVTKPIRMMNLAEHDAERGGILNDAAGQEARKIELEPWPNNSSRDSGARVKDSRNEAKLASIRLMFLGMTEERCTVPVLEHGAADVAQVRQCGEVVR